MKQKQIARPLFPEKLTQAFLTLMLLFFPLYIGSDGYQQISSAKFDAFCWLCGGYLCLMLLLAVEMPLMGQARLLSPPALWKRASLAQRLVFLYWACTALSALFSPYGSVALWGSGRHEGLLTISIYCGCFLCVSAFGRLKPWLLSLFGAGMILVSLLAFVQLSGKNPFGLYPAGYNYYDAGTAYPERFLSTIGNVGLLAALLCVAIPAFAVGFLRLKGKGRYFLLLPLSLSALLLVLIDVDAGFLGIAAGFLLLPPLVAQKNRRLLLLLVVILLVLALLFLYFYPGPEEGFLYEASQILHGHAEDSYGSGRIFIWRTTWDLVKEQPLLGGGPDTLGLRTDAVFERYDPVLNLNIRTLVDTAHNEYLNILVNQGIFALLCYIGALLCSAMAWIRRGRSNPVAAVCGSAVLCYCIQAFFGISTCISAPFFWLLWALLERSLREEPACVK